MKNYVFVCIGTDKLIIDSFGPRVGNYLQKSFKLYPEIKVFGTMQSPIHFKNANVFLEQLKNMKKDSVILIDSAFSKLEKIGSTYVSYGGISIGKAFGKELYFPAQMNITTVVANKTEQVEWNEDSMQKLSNKVANQITKIVTTQI